MKLTQLLSSLSTPSTDQLVIPLHSDERLSSNRIRSTRSTILTFLPKQLYSEFSKIANLYFLFIAILQQIPGISTTGKMSVVFPLSVFITLAIIHEAYDEFKRYYADRMENEKPCRRLTPQGEIETLRWRDVAVGDVIELRQNELVPADTIVLATSLDDHVCYVETANLDGETNLKPRAVVDASLAADVHSIFSTPGKVCVEAPNKDLHSFNGYVKLGDRQVPLSPKNLLLRGTRLMHTPTMYGFVVYTGELTKMRLNALQDVPVKRPAMQRHMNRAIFMLICFLVALTVTISLMAIYWEKSTGALAWYLPDFGLSDMAKYFFGFVVLFHNLIPISLYITMELIKVIQAWMITQDVEMFDHDNNVPVEAHTTVINEDLGQVKWLFSDKTGTLTQNVMKLEAFAIGSHAFHVDAPDAMSKFKRLSVRAQSAENWFTTAIATCHGVSLFPTEDGKGMQYQSTSPDEDALMDGLREYVGWELISRQKDTIGVKDCAGHDMTYKVLATIEFTSKRKRMSVLVQSPQGEIYLISKGADNIIKSRFKHVHEPCTVQGLDDTLDARRATDRQIDAFANKGLRVLVYAMRHVPQHEYDAWNIGWQAASASITDRQALLDACAEEIEVRLELLGITAVEDKLQVGVPETIAKLRQAEICVWMLTGDKLETAVNIGKSSKLIDEHALVAIVSGMQDDPSTSKAVQTRQALDEAIQLLCDQGAGKSRALVVDGDALLVIQDDVDMTQQFLSAALLANTVVCSRVSPSQKADIVNMVQKQYPHDVTLAIGDGGNDCAMIQAARVGIGIAGKEGMQAARASDFSIGQFRFLQRLLFVHGHWSYTRIATFALATLYKSTAFYCAQLVFQFFVGFSGTSLYEEWSVSMYIFYSLLPAVMIGLFNQDLSADTLMRVPELYAMGHQPYGFNLVTFLRWEALGLFHAALAVCVPFLAFSGIAVAEATLSSPQLYMVSVTSYSIVMFLVTIKIGLVSYSKWSYLNVSVVLFTLALFFTITSIFSATYSPAGSDLGYYVRHVFFALMHTWNYVLLVLIAVVIGFLPDLVVRSVVYTFWPTKLFKYQTWEKFNLIEYAADLEQRELVVVKE